MTGRIEKTVFISYRRTNLPWALCIYQNLTMHGYDVFFDYQSIDSGNFDRVILENIKARAHFLIVLTPSALDRCKEPGDWLRREIETAIEEKRNIVPLMLESFDFGSPQVKQALTGNLSTLNNYNGLHIPSEYFLEAMDRLRNRFLNVTISDIALPSLDAEAQEITESQKIAANQAAQVEIEQLTAQEWFERGFTAYQVKNFEEAVRCLSEAIRLDVNFAEAYALRGAVKHFQENFNDALLDYRLAILAKPEFAEAYVLNAATLDRTGDSDRAIADLTKAISLTFKRGDDLGRAYSIRGQILIKKNNINGAIDDFNKALFYNENDAIAYRNRGNALKDIGNYNSALADFDKAITIDSENAELYTERGLTHRIMGNFEKSINDYVQALRIKPNHLTAVLSLFSVLKKLGRNAEAEEQEAVVRELIAKDTEYNQACFEAIKGNTKKALELLETGLEKKQATQIWARQDPDFENIRNDSRFKELVGE